ncbi:platelet-activating factor acetylhydrolase-like [Ruditapes philippinarum]|uniref:platelet-activating factor acetylhydrolase-like n=1 Tax=Ruditapes philippinarum TaxID=129788 RepID=UPI00295AE95B|nr:platelet-activating factor acetylhydrolase-like [Ruditapes philippinarum]
MGKFFNWIGGDIYIPVLWQAPLLESDDKLPVLVMSHGIGGNRTTYSTFCCEIASHGFIVVVPEHRDGSASMTYLLKDNMRGTVVELLKDHECGLHRRHTMHKSHSFTEEWQSFEHTDPLGIQWDDYDYRNKQVHQRASECIRLLDVLTDINDGRSVRNFLGFHFSLKQFKGRMDMSKVAFAGHSFGGSTCVTTLGQDKRFKVGIMLDAWMHPLNEELCSKVTQPVLILNYEKFQWQKNVKQMSWLQSDDVDRTMLTLRGACHQAISDFQFIVGKAFGKLMEVRSDLSPKVAMDVNKRATLGFLSKHLGLDGLDSGNDVLTGSHKDVILGTTLDVT